MLRGVAIMRRVACMKLPDPQSLNIQVVPPAPDPAKSTRDRYDIHATDAACASCHATIDQIGFSFEMFDGMGKQRPAGTASGTYKDAHLGANGALTTVNTTSSDDDRHHLAISPATSRAPTPTATRWRRRSGKARRCASAWRGSSSARRRGAATIPSSTPSSPSSTRGSRCLPISRASSSRCWSPTCAARCSINGAPREEAQRQSSFLPEGRRRRRHRAAVLPAAGELGRPGGRRSGPAAVLRHLPPARHRGRVLRDAERQVLGADEATPRPPSTSPTRTTAPSACCSRSTTPRLTARASRARSSRSRAST